MEAYLKSNALKSGTAIESNYCPADAVSYNERIVYRINYEAKIRTLLLIQQPGFTG